MAACSVWNAANAIPTGGIGGVVTVSGEAVNDSDSGGATGGIRFNSDGTIDKLEGASYSQIDSGTDWIIPNIAASGDFDVRCTNVSSGTSDDWTTEPAAEDVWINLGSDREWKMAVSAPFGLHDLTCDFEVRYNGGAAEDTGTFTLDLIVSP